VTTNLGFCVVSFPGRLGRRFWQLGLFRVATTWKCWRVPLHALCQVYMGSKIVAPVGRCRRLRMCVLYYRHAEIPLRLAKPASKLSRQGRGFHSSGLNQVQYDMATASRAASQTSHGGHIEQSDRHPLRTEVGRVLVARFEIASGAMLSWLCSRTLLVFVLGPGPPLG
jgi:hypothetical protein